jgi:hypothetical protein
LQNQRLVVRAKHLPFERVRYVGKFWSTFHYVILVGRYTLWKVGMKREMVLVEVVLVGQKTCSWVKLFE